MSDTVDAIAALMNPDVPPEMSKIFPGATSVRVPTTDEMDSITAEERRKLVAYCEFCEEWWKFTRDMDPTPEEEVCPKCNGKPSKRNGFQMITQRSFNPTMAKKKLPKKR